MTDTQQPATVGTIQSNTVQPSLLVVEDHQSDALGSIQTESTSSYAMGVTLTPNATVSASVETTQVSQPDNNISPTVAVNARNLPYGVYWSAIDASNATIGYNSQNDINDLNLSNVDEVQKEHEATTLARMFETAGSFNWNVSFQSTFELLKDAILTNNTQSEIECYEKLAALANDFIYVSKLYGKIIITERHLPYDLKTIKPITRSLGGIAGGSKYLVHGEVFICFICFNSDLF